MNASTFDPDVVVDTHDCILGRVASRVAERALDGERIAVVNAEGAIITGDAEDVTAKFQSRRAVGSDRGPMYPKRPDGIFKRSVRGMLPYKKPRGREALENVHVYVGNPFEERDGEVLEDTSLDRLSHIRFVSLGDVSESIGANVTW